MKLEIVFAPDALALLLDTLEPDSWLCCILLNEINFLWDTRPFGLSFVDTLLAANVRVSVGTLGFRKTHSLLQLQQMLSVSGNKQAAAYTNLQTTHA